MPVFSLFKVSITCSSCISIWWVPFTFLKNISNNFFPQNLLLINKQQALEFRVTIYLRKFFPSTLVPSIRISSAGPSLINLHFWLKQFPQWRNFKNKFKPTFHQYFLAKNGNFKTRYRFHFDHLNKG